MPTCCEYSRERDKKYRPRFLALAREAKQAGNEELHKKYLRVAWAMTWQIRIAKQRLAQGKSTMPSLTTEKDRDALDHYLELHGCSPIGG